MRASRGEGGSCLRRAWPGGARGAMGRAGGGAGVSVGDLLRSGCLRPCCRGGAWLSVGLVARAGRGGEGLVGALAEAWGAGWGSSPKRGGGVGWGPSPGRGGASRLVRAPRRGGDLGYRRASPRRSGRGWAVGRRPRGSGLELPARGPLTAAGLRCGQASPRPGGTWAVGGAASLPRPRLLAATVPGQPPPSLGGDPNTSLSHPHPPRPPPRPMCGQLRKILHRLTR